MRIKIVDCDNGQLDAEELAQAIRSLQDVGVVILENAVSLTLIEHVRDIYLEALARGQQLKHPPMEMPFLDHRLVANSFALQIMEAAMGSKIAWGLYYIHAVAPGAKAGTPHRDGNHLFAELPFPLPVSGIFVDIPLVDFTAENGATRLWPGTHLLVDNPPTEVRNLNERSQHLPCLQMIMPAGSLVLRDMRLWHAAMPNETDEIRPMLDLGYTRVFPHAHERLPVPQEFKMHWSKAARQLIKTGYVQPTA